MFCPQCETEYREGFSRCSDCDVALVPELGAAALVPLTMETGRGVVTEVVDGLESSGIPYVVESGTALRLLDADGDALEAPEPWEARIWVTKAKVEQSGEILKKARAEGRKSEADHALFAAVWRFRTSDPEQFEAHYGRDGTWTRFFGRDPEYVGTNLLKSDSEYLTIDWWTSRAAYEAFRAANKDEYAKIDRLCEEVTDTEERVGEFET